MRMTRTASNQSTASLDSDTKPPSLPIPRSNNLQPSEPFHMTTRASSRTASVATGSAAPSVASVESRPSSRGETTAKIGGQDLDNDRPSKKARLSPDQDESKPLDQPEADVAVHGVDSDKIKIEQPEKIDEPLVGARANRVQSHSSSSQTNGVHLNLNHEPIGSSNQPAPSQPDEDEDGDEIMEDEEEDDDGGEPAATREASNAPEDEDASQADGMLDPDESVAQADVDSETPHASVEEPARKRAAGGRRGRGGKRPKGWNLRRANKQLLAAGRMPSLPPPDDDFAAADNHSPAKQQAGGILDRLPGRRRAPHENPNVEADMRRQLELKVAYRAVVKALKPVLIELAERTVKDLDADKEHVQRYDEYHQVMDELDARLDARLRILHQEMSLQEGSVVEEFEANERRIRNEFVRAVDDSAERNLIRCEHEMIKIFRNYQRQEDEQATDDEGDEIPRQYKSMTRHRNRRPLNAKYESRSQAGILTDQLWNDLGVRLDFAKRQEQHDVESFVKHPKDFAVYDGDIRRSAHAVHMLNTLLDATEVVEAESQKKQRRVESAAASGLQALASASALADVKTEGEIRKNGAQSPAFASHRASVAEDKVPSKPIQNGGSFSQRSPHHHFRQILKEDPREEPSQHRQRLPEAEAMRVERPSPSSYYTVQAIPGYGFQRASVSQPSQPVPMPGPGRMTPPAASRPQGLGSPFIRHANHEAVHDRQQAQMLNDPRPPHPQHYDHHGPPMQAHYGHPQYHHHQPPPPPPALAPGPAPPPPHMHVWREDPNSRYPPSYSQPVWPPQAHGMGPPPPPPPPMYSHGPPPPYPPVSAYGSSYGHRPETPLSPGTRVKTEDGDAHGAHASRTSIDRGRAGPGMDRPPHDPREGSSLPILAPAQPPQPQTVDQAPPPPRTLQPAHVMSDRGPQYQPYPAPAQPVQPNFIQPHAFPNMFAHSTANGPVSILAAPAYQHPPPQPPPPHANHPGQHHLSPQAESNQAPGQSMLPHPQPPQYSPYGTPRVSAGSLPPPGQHRRESSIAHLQQDRRPDSSAPSPKILPPPTPLPQLLQPMHQPRHNSLPVSMLTHPGQKLGQTPLAPRAPPILNPNMAGGHSASASSPPQTPSMDARSSSNNVNDGQQQLRWQTPKSYAPPPITSGQQVDSRPSSVHQNVGQGWPGFGKKGGGPLPPPPPP